MFVRSTARVLVQQCSNSFKISRQYNAQSLYDQILLTTKGRLNVSGRLYSNNVNFTKNLVGHPLSNCSRNLIVPNNQCGYQISRRCFRTTPPNYIAPQVLIILSRVAKFGAAFLGRSVRKWYANLTPDEKLAHTQRLKRNSKYLFGLCGAVGFGLFVYHDTHVQETPITKRKRFVAFTPEQFDQIARLEFKGLLETYKQQIVPASLRDPLYRRVSKVAHKILNANKDLDAIKNKDWTITLVNDDSIQNAFVLPCGNIFVFTGMLTICETDDELAFILAHEMAHAVLSHGAENASFVHLMDMIFVLPVAVLWAILPSDATAALLSWVGGSLKSILVSLPYAREMETEADNVGLILATKACYDVRVAPIFWAKMKLIQDRDGLPDIEFLSTHPSHESRQAQLDEAMNGALIFREKCQCPPLPYFDPRKRLEEYKKKVDSDSTFENVAIRLRV